MGSKSKKDKHKKNKQKQLKYSDNTQDDKVEQIDSETKTIEMFVNNEDNFNISNKRDYEADETEIKEEPHKKKKKKQQVSSEAGVTSDKKGKKSIRQMKREKFALRQAEAATVAKDQLKTQCLSYLSQWKHDRQNWKFMKVKQLWLFKNKFTANLIPDASWPILLEYFNSAKGNIRNMLLEDANKVIKNMDDWIESQKENNVEEDEEENPKSVKPDDISYKRARDLIQCLEE